MVEKPASFKDHFSVDSDAYQRHRPGYPKAMYSFLAGLAAETKLAWDCASGNGQSAILLSAFFGRVIATDASASQIKQAVQMPGVTYRVASAECSGIAPLSVDLITVAQALHWFDLPAFTEEVERVLKPGGVLAVWSYNLLQVNADIDAEVRSLYHDVLGEYWPPERQMVEQAYASVAFPFETIEVSQFEMTANWSLADLFGYLQTWSALKRYQKEHLHNPLDDLRQSLADAWGDSVNTLPVSWCLSLKVWRKPL